MIEASGDHAMYIGDYPTAVSEYSEVVQRRPGRWHARVELGKALAGRIVPELESASEPDLAHYSSTNALIRHYRKLRGC